MAAWGALAEIAAQPSDAAAWAESCKHARTTSRRRLRQAWPRLLLRFAPCGTKPAAHPQHTARIYQNDADKNALRCYGSGRPAPGYRTGS